MTSSIQIDIRNQIQASIVTKQFVLENHQIISQIEALANICLAALNSGGKIIFAGNGGSFADAQHLSAEFTSRFLFDRAPLASLALGTNNSAMSAISNDYGYDQVFARELRCITKPGDVFIPISTSGNSPNILAAAKVSKDLGIPTIALTGIGGGQLKLICECISMPSTDTARIQECHIMVGHILCRLVEAQFFKR